LLFVPVMAVCSGDARAAPEPPDRRKRLTTGGQTIWLRDVAAGAEVTAGLRIRSDDHFAVAGRLADGTVVARDIGYATTGMAGERARFVVTPWEEL
jgi:hypothetical protein